MRISKVLWDVNSRFQTSVDDALVLMLECDTWRRSVDGVSRPILKKHKADVISLSFVKLLLAWEEFLEESFLRLLITKNIRGVKSLLNVRTKNEAFKIIKGDGRQFIDWADVKRVRERAKIYFKNGKPFEYYLAAGSLHIDRMRIIRNRIAHRSEFSRKQFEDLVRQLFGAYNAETPGTLLFRRPPSNFGLPPDAIVQPTIAQTYASIVKVTATKIAS